MMKAQIDDEYLLELAGEDKESILRIIDDFAIMSADSLNHLLAKVVLPELELDALAQTLHQLKGSSSSLGMVSLARMFAEMEKWGLEEWKNTGYHHTELIQHLENSVLLCKEALV